MMRAGVLGMAVVTALGLAPAAPDSSPRSGSGPLRRSVLALYDSARAPEPRATIVHALAEMPLNHLGLIVRYHDLRQGLPGPDALRGVRGVVTWFESDSIPNPRAYLRWVETLASSGIPLASLGALGGTRDERGQPMPLDEVNRAFERLGWRFEGGWHTTTTGAAFSVSEPGLIGFERPLPRLVPPYATVHATAPDAHVALRVSARHRPLGASDLVIVSPRGAFVAPGYAYFSDRVGAREFRQWYVNPFALFRIVFRTDDIPKPDTTTVSGRRIYYSHIDGDGWRNLTQIEPHRSRYVIAARVVLDEVVRKYPDLPVAVAPIVGDLDPEWHGTAESLDIARQLFELPHVEPAVHTYSHPLDWARFDTRAGRRVTPVGARGPDVLTGEAYEKPRVYDTRPFSLRTEVEEAAAFVDALLPPGKRVRLLQWSGDTRPFEEALVRVKRAGLANINGGDTRFDREFPSAAWVSPLGAWIGRELQVYASNSNENTYTDLWRDRFFGFSFLSRTVRNTGEPRRLKPFNVYYHMYSGERLSSLNAVKANLDFARTLPLAPVDASRFSRIVEGFFSTALEPAGPRRWRVRDRGALQTIRFDGPAATRVDFAASVGVIGQRHELGSLFVALDEAVETPIIALTPVADPAGARPNPGPYLVESRWRVHDVQRAADRLRFVSEGYGAGEALWHWPGVDATTVVWRTARGRSGRAVVRPDGSGRLALGLPALDGEPVEVTITAAGREPHGVR